MNGEEYRAVVEKIMSNGRHGPYAVARSDELGSVTFSLSRDVWKEKGQPETGTIVILGQIIKKRAGWRAQHGRFARPSDEATARSN